MNHCILGGLGDGDDGEDGEEGSGGAGDSFPTAGIMGEHRPLAPFFHGFLGALPISPMEMGSIGRGKNVALVAANSWVEMPWAN